MRERECERESVREREVSPHKLASSRDAVQRALCHKHHDHRTVGHCHPILHHLSTLLMKMIRRVPGSHHSHGSEASSTRTFTRAFMTTKITSVCDGIPSFRHFGHLSCFVWRDCHSLFSCHKHDICTAFFLMLV